MLQEHSETEDSATVFKGNRKGVCVSVCFMCDDAITLYHEFKSQGIDVREPIVGNGSWEILLTDPDGFNLLFESETDVPEETRYSDWIAKNQ